MIFDKIENLRKYDVVSDNILEFLFNLSENTPNGRYEIDENTYANIEEYETKPIEKGLPEAHKRYIDIQILLSGTERLDFTNIEGLTIQKEYNEEKDIEFFDNPRLMNSVYLQNGYFALLYPHDAHRPQMQAFEKPELVKKVVVKILCI